MTLLRLVVARVLRTWFCVGGVIFATLFASASAQQDAVRGISASEGGTDGEHWRNPANCGVNSVYMFLKILGTDADYEAVRQQVPISRSGSTLRSMKDAVRSFGVEARVVKGSPAQLRDCPMPAIAHVESGNAPEGGHFVVLLSTDDTVVRYIDGTLGTLQDSSTDVFVRQWTGYLLVAERESNRWTLVIMTLAVGVGGCLLLHSMVKRRPL